MPAAKPITGQLDIRAWRNDDWFEYPIRIVGLDVSGLELAMEIREAGDVGGPPLVHLAKVTIEQTEAQGLRVAGVSVVDGVPKSDLRIRMDRGTLQDLPYYGAFGDAAAFKYALLIGGRTRLEGEFILPAHAYGSDAAPDDRQMAIGYAGSSALPVGGATLEISNDGGAAVVIDGADVLGGLREASEAARDVSVAAAAQAVVALDNLSRDALEFIGRPGDATLVNGTAVSTGAIYWRDAVDHAGTFGSLDLFDKAAGTVRVAVYRGAPAALTRVGLTSVATIGSGAERTVALAEPIAVRPGDIIALQAQVAGAFSVKEVQSGDAGYTYSFPDLPETIALDAPTTNGQVQVRFRIAYREQIVTAESFAALSAVKILSPRAVALSSAANPRGYVDWTTTGQPTAHTISWGRYTAKLDGQAQRFEFPDYSLSQPFAFSGNSLTDETDEPRWPHILAARYGQPYINTARYSSDGRQVYRTGAKPIVLTLAGALPANGSVAVSQINGAAIDGNNPAAFLTTGDAGLTTGMSLSGYLERNGVTVRATVSAPNGASFAYRVAQAAGQTAIAFDGPVTFVPDFAVQVRGRIAIVWIGNNFFFSEVANEYGDHTNPGMWVDYKLVVAFLQARGCRVLLLPIIPSTNTAPDDNWVARGLGTPYTAMEAANARTEALFPGLMARHADGRTFLQFLQSRNDGSANDLADIAGGFTPRSLRRKPDGSYDKLHLYGNGSGDLAVADFVDSALQAQHLPDAITQTTEFAIAAFGADWQEADTALVRVGRDAVVADLADALDGVLTDLAYRPTLASAVADFDVGTFFTSRDLGGVNTTPGAVSGVKRQYQIIAAAPYWADRGPWAEAEDVGLDPTRDADKPVSGPQGFAIGVVDAKADAAQATADRAKLLPLTAGMSADEHDAIVSAALATGEPVVYPPGLNFYTKTGFAVVDLPVQLSFNGSRVFRAVDAANEPLLKVTHTFLQKQAVMGAIGLLDINLDSTDVNNLTRVNRIQLADTSGWEVGSQGRIVSDDLIPWGRAGDNERLAEDFRVARVEVDAIYTLRPLRVPVTRNIRVARRRVLPCVISDFNAEDAPGSPLTRNASMLWLIGVSQPRLIDPIVRNALGEALRFTSCAEPYTSGAQLYNLRTSAFYKAYGYGIREEGCTDGLHIGARGGRLRHLFTTGAYSSLVDNDPLFERYGGCIGTRVVGAFATETEHNAFDTHSDALDVTFEGCKASGNYRGEDGSLYAFKLRGKGTKMLGCETFGPGAAYLQPETGGGFFEILEHVHTTPQSYGSTQVFGGLNYGAGRAPAMICARIRTEAHIGNLMGFSGFDIRGSMNVDWDVSATGNPRFIDHVNSTVRLHELRMRLTGVPSVTVLAGAYFQDATSSYRVDHMIMEAGALPFYYANFAPASPGPGGFAASATIGRMDTDRPPGVGTLGVINPGSASIYHANVEVTFGTGPQPSALVVNLTTSYPQSLSLKGRGEPTIVMELRANSVTAATRELTIATAPERAGQKLILWAQDASASANQKPIVLKNSALVKLGADIVMTPGMPAMLAAAPGGYWVKGA